MKIYNDIDSVRIKNPIITIGTFDGVHLGHQEIFNQVKKLAKSCNGESVVITFWPHPRMVIKSESSAVLHINTIEEKIELIKKQGIDHFVILPFTKEFSQLSSHEFIDEILHKKIGIKGLIVGYDHKFGKDREGDFNVLMRSAKKYNFIIEKVEAHSVNNQKVSSTIIRNALLNGKIEYANSFLSRHFTLSGIVSNGHQVGRNLGFPTANIKPETPYKLVPFDGVYAVKVYIENREYIGMLNIGTRPTFKNSNENKSIETHIINFDGNLYGKIIKLSFHKRVRDEMKFNSIDDLKAQLAIDKYTIEAYFKKS